MTIKLVEISLGDNIPFHALSYTWGDPKNSVAVHLGEYVLSVTVHLDRFLRRLRDKVADAEETQTTQYYWVDQICINQQDIPERNRQVALMAEIYQKSQRTLIWLGELESDTTPSAINLLLELDQLGCTRDTSICTVLQSAGSIVEKHFSAIPDKELKLTRHQNSNPSLMIGLLNVLNRKWFTRAWIIQEAALANECTIHLGSHTFNWATMDLLVIALSWVASRKHGKEALRMSPWLMSPAAHTIRVVQSIRKQWVSRRMTAHAGDFLQTLRRISFTSECSDHRDRVNAFLSLQDPPVLPPADYNLSVKEVYANCSARLAEVSRSLDIFGYTRSIPFKQRETADRVYTDHPEVPSWAIDWSHRGSVQTGPVSDVESTFVACGDFTYTPAPSPSADVLVVRGKSIDSIDIVSDKDVYPSQDILVAMFRLRREDVLSLAQRLYYQAECVATDTDDRVYNRVVKTLLLYDHKLDTDGKWNEKFETAIQVFEGFLDRMGKQADPSLRPTPQEEIQFSQIGRRYTHKRSRLLCLSRHRRLFGLVPFFSQSGDQICIFHGSRAPVVLRKSPTNNRYILLGQCYLEDWMHGEKIDWCEGEADVFELE
jgi:hypothetical protein